MGALVGLYWNKPVSAASGSNAGEAFQPEWARTVEKSHMLDCGFRFSLN